MKKKAALFLAVVLAVSTLAGCTKKEEAAATKPTETTLETKTETTAETKTGTTAETPTEAPSTSTGDKTLAVQIGPDPETIDPALNSAVDGGNMILYTHECLLVVDQNNQIAPGQAESYDVSADGLTWTFHLRDGIGVGLMLRCPIDAIYL